MTVVDLERGDRVEAHLADRGRLEGIIYPGAEVYVAPANNPKRKTAFTLLCARCPSVGGAPHGPLGPTDPSGANRQVRALLEAGELTPELGAIKTIRAEVKVGSSQIDFELVSPSGDLCLVEVKSALAARADAALFPDAPSERATRHARELIEQASAGHRTAIVLVAQRADIACIRPHPVDPSFATALANARAAGVMLIGVAFEADLEGLHYRGRRPIYVEPPPWKSRTPPSSAS